MTDRIFAARGTLLLSLFLTGAGPMPAPAQPTPDACFSTNARASLDIRIDSCTSAIQSGRLSPDRLSIAFQNRGAAFIAKGDPNRAIQDFDRAISLDPNYANAFNGRGVAYQAKGDNDRAIQDYGQAIRLDPGNANALNGRCWLRAASGQLQAALADCNESLRLRPNSSNSLDSRAFVHILLGHWNEAIADSDAAFRADPRNAYALFERGVAKLRKGDAAGGNADIAASRAIDAKAEIEFASLGVKL
jgi:tetratricopeptide (TPR) repeat protein